MARVKKAVEAPKKKEPKKKASKKKNVVEQADSGVKKAKKKSKKKRTFNRFIYKVLRKITPEHGISNKAMSIMNSFVFNMLDRLGTEAGLLVQRSKVKTIGAREIHGAVRLIMPGELATHANIEGRKAFVKYMNSFQ